MSEYGGRVRPAADHMNGFGRAVSEYGGRVRPAADHMNGEATP